MGASDILKELEPLVESIKYTELGNDIIVIICSKVKDRFNHLKTGIKYSLDYMVEEAFKCSYTVEPRAMIIISIKRSIGIVIS